MKVLSRSSEYGLRALMYMVGKNAEKEYVSIREMSETLQISFHFLTKILQTLTQAELLVSYRGPNCGVAFKRSPREIKLSEVVRILEGDDFFDTCLLGLPGCGEAKPCPLHHIWKDVRGVLKQEFEATSLDEMGQSVLINRFRLSV